VSTVPATPALDPVAWRRETASLGMWIFLATELMFFGALFFGYLHVRLGDPQGVAAASRHTHEWLGTINTAILLTSSFTMALAVRAATLGQRRAARRLLWATAALGVAFLAVKATEYGLEWRDGLVPGLHFTVREHAQATALFFFLYFLMTGVHALHLAIGIVAVAWLAWRLREARLPEWRVEEIDVLGLYWHFVDAVWIFLYPLFYLVDLAR
jgi:cytochrome c oxidase subunit III